MYLPSLFDLKYFSKGLALFSVLAIFVIPVHAQPKPTITITYPPVFIDITYSNSEFSKWKI
jgi:hypothetical protein